MTDDRPSRAEILRAIRNGAPVLMPGEPMHDEHGEWIGMSRNITASAKLSDALQREIEDDER